MNSLPTLNRAKPPAASAISGWPRATPAAAAGEGLDRDETELIRRIREGDHNAFYELIHPYERAVYLAAVSLKNDADADEVAQEAILKAFKNLSRFRQEAKFSTWLIQITINEGKMKLRKDRRYLYESLDEGQPGEEGDYIPKDFADWREIPSETLEQSEFREALGKAMRSLPEKYRTVLMLRDIQHLSITETAQALALGGERENQAVACPAADARRPGPWFRRSMEERKYEKIRPF